MAVCLAAGFAMTYNFPVHAEDAGDTLSGIRILFSGALGNQIDAYSVYDEETDRYSSPGGFARLASLVRQFDAENALVLDAGGFSAGSSYDVLAAESPSLHLMQAMGYDAVTLGDEEFRFGYDMLVSGASGTEGIAVLSSSIVPHGTQEADVLLQNGGPQIMERNGVKIGVFGAMSDSAGALVPEDLRYDILSQSEAAAAAVSQLSAEGAEYVICLYHGTPDDAEALQDAADLARSVDGIDMIIAAESENPLMTPQKMDDTWIVSAGMQGRYLGVADINPEDNTLTMHRIVPSSADVAEDGGMAAQIGPVRERRNAALQQAGIHGGTIIGNVNHSLGDPFGYRDRQEQTQTELLAADAIAYAWHRSPESGRTNAISIIPRSLLQHELVRGDVTNDDLLGILSSGGSLPAGKLITVYLRGSDLLKLCEIDHTLGAADPHFRFAFGNLRYHYQNNRMKYNRISAVSVQETDGYWASFSANTLYPAVMPEGTVERLQLAAEMTDGILEIPFYTKDGTEISNIAADRRLTDVSGTEVTQIAAMQDYITFFSRNVDGRHDISSYYAGATHVRTEDTLTLTSFFRNTTPYAWKKYGKAALAAAAVLAAWKVLRFLAKRLFPRIFRENF